VERAGGVDCIGLYWTVLDLRYDPHAIHAFGSSNIHTGTSVIGEIEEIETKQENLVTLQLSIESSIESRQYSGLSY